MTEHFNAVLYHIAKLKKTERDKLCFIKKHLQSSPLVISPSPTAFTASIISSGLMISSASLSDTNAVRLSKTFVSKLQFILAQQFLAWMEFHTCIRILMTHGLTIFHYAPLILYEVY